MRLPPTRPARFVARPNRFVVQARLRPGGPAVPCFCPNPGRLGELLVAGAPLRVVAAPGGRDARRTGHDAVLVRHAGVWVGLDTRAAGPVFREAVEEGRVEGLSGPLEAEVPAGGSRLDFRVGGQLVEVKCVSLVEEGLARFPDAPSERAARHARVLTQAARRGVPGTMAFVVVRPDAEAWQPNDVADPAFARALRAAARAGVRVRAFTCATAPRGLRLAREVPALLR